LRASDQEGVVADLFEAVGKLPCRWDVLRIGRLLESSPIAEEFIKFLAGSGLAHRIRREQPSFLLSLDHGYDGFLASRSPKFRNYLRRKTRKLEAAGRLEVRRAGHDVAVEEAYGHLLEIEARSWKHANGSAISDRPRQREFYRLLCEGASRSGRLHLMVMYLDDRPIAFNLGITAGDRYSYLKTSFDEELRPYSPATVLRARLVESLCAEGIRSLDFPAEPYRWEEQWTDRLRWHCSVLAFNRTPMGLLYRLLVRLQDVLRPARTETNVNYVDPRQPKEA
jgi:CelD/BcsL family acetyltransferase involved in cellulose biosynthesis